MFLFNPSRYVIFSRSFIPSFSPCGTAALLFIPPSHADCPSRTDSLPLALLLARALELLLVSVANSSSSLSLILSLLYDSFPLFCSRILQLLAPTALFVLSLRSIRPGIAACPSTPLKSLASRSDAAPLVSFSSLREQAGSIGSNARA